jgi:thiosulfate dehydrogenase
MNTAKGLICLVAIAIASVAYAKEPFTKAQTEDQQRALWAAVKRGYDLWHSPKLGTNGLACANCHPDASASNPHTWPKYQTDLGKVGTLREMINWCIQVPLQGKAISQGSQDMIDMEAYATYMHRGIALAPGKNEQNGGVPVKSGPGFPTGNDGNR